MSADLPVISLYTGAGGLDLGLEAAGFRIAVALEMDKYCCQTLRLNRPALPVVERPVAEVASETLLELAGLRSGEPCLVVGGPPCQPFSKSSYWSNGDTRRLEDPRADTLSAFIRVVRDVIPRAFVIENVHGLIYRGKDEGLRHLLELVDEVNTFTGCHYRVSWAVLNAAEYGVPQFRERVFLIASRDGQMFRFPEPRFQAVSPEKGQTLFNIPALRTAWDAIGDLPEDADGEDLAVHGKWGDLLPSIPEGMNYLWHTDHKGGLPLFGWRTRYWGFLLKLAKAAPSWTIQASPGPAIGPFHWRNRRLSKRELMRLQTFPDDYEISGPRGEVQRQIGNAVPSLLTEVLGREIRVQFLGAPHARSELKLLPPDRSPAPVPEQLLEVPQKYHRLAGNHAAHPGTGKGPRAFAKV